MKRLLLAITAIACGLAIAIPVLAEEDGPITVDGITFDSVTEYFLSDYFRENGKRCGTVIREDLQDRDDPSDCAVITRPLEIYEPGETIQIPVVVHILTTTSGTGDLSDATVHSQINVLNEDFQALPGTPGAPGYDIKLEFVLATTDPDGNPTTGITRDANNDWYNDNGSYWAYLAWDPHRYLNIYSNNPGGGILGYVPWLPHQGNPGHSSDRVVIWYRAFGDPGTYPPYNLGRTCTHEVGHFLGLYHTFQGGCGTSNCNYTGDTICDTEPEANYRFGCPGSATSCGTPDPIHNYMDYTDDDCMDNFTNEQARRVRCTLEHYRPDLRGGDLTSVPEQPANAKFAELHQNVPNPFNPKTRISFELAASGKAGLQVIDVAGRVIRSYSLGTLAEGAHEITWDGQDDLGQPLSSGVYFYRLSVEGQESVTKRMVMLK